MFKSKSERSPPRAAWVEEEEGSEGEQGAGGSEGADDMGDTEGAEASCPEPVVALGLALATERRSQRSQRLGWKEGSAQPGSATDMAPPSPTSPDDAEVPEGTEAGAEALRELCGGRCVRFGGRFD
jgi:hypothetical protein